MGKPILFISILLLVSLACGESIERKAVETAVAEEDEAMEPLEPTSTPTFGLTTEERAYAEFVIENLGGYGQWLTILSELIFDVGENPYLIFDEDWIYETATGLVKLELYAGKLAGYEDVPDKFIKVHQWFMMIDPETRLLISNFVAGIDSVDVEKLEAAIVNMNNIAEYLNKANEELEKLIP
jgi:hypothetical protein